MFIDTHCHLTSDEFKNNLNDVLIRAKSNNIGKMICASAHFDDFPLIIDLINSYDNIYGTLGVHPDYADQNVDFDLMKNLALNNKKIVAIGECGLDYYEDENKSDIKKNQQADLFIKHIELAKSLNLPVVIHTRDASFDTENILKNEFKKSGFVSVLHCYTGSWESAKQLLNLGFFFSASGIVTFKNADRVRDVFSKIPLDRIIVETDSPYCAPVPYRGHVNEPAYVYETAKMIADIKNLDILEIENILYHNTKTVFNGIN